MKYKQLQKAQKLAIGYLTAHVVERYMCKNDDMK